MKDMKDTHQLAAIVSCIAVALAVVYPTEVLIMASFRDCKELTTTDSDGNVRPSPQKCGKHFGTKKDSEHNAWNISKMEGCVAEGLRERYDAWNANGETVKFWSPDNNSYFNFYDFQAAPAIMLSTRKVSAHTHLGYNQTDVAGFKNVIASGNRQAMYERQPIYISAWSVLLVLIIIAGLEYGGVNNGTVNNSTIQSIRNFLVFSFLFLGTFALFSTFYGFLYASGTLSPFPTDPIAAASDPINGDYELIPMANLTFTPDPKRCPRGVMEELNKDQGELFHEATGVNAKTMFALVTIGAVFYFMPLIMILVKHSQELDRTSGNIHLFVYLIVLVVGALMFAVTDSNNFDDRCGTNSPGQLGGLGAFYGYHTQSTVTQVLENLVHGLVVGFAICGLLYEFLESFFAEPVQGSEPGKSPKTYSFTLVKRTINAADNMYVFVGGIITVVILEAYILATYVSINASDLCGPTLTHGGRVFASIIFFIVMGSYLVFALFRIYKDMMTDSNAAGQESVNVSMNRGYYKQVSTQNNNLAMSMI